MAWSMSAIATGSENTAKEPERPAYAPSRFTRSNRVGGWKYIRRDASTAKVVYKGRQM